MIPYVLYCKWTNLKQLIAEAKNPIGAARQLASYDYKYRHCGRYNVFLVYEPLAGKLYLKILET